MGRKLEDWERSQRDRNQELERLEKANATQHRRLMLKIEKQEEFYEEYQKSERIVNIWESIFFKINRLQVVAYNFFNDYDTLKDLFLKNQVKILSEYSRDILFVPLNEISIDNFLENEFLETAKIESEYSLDDYCRKYEKKYIPLLKFLFKNIKREFDLFIDERSKLIENEEIRKKQYKLLLDQYKKLEINYLNTFNQSERGIRDTFLNELKDFNTEISSKNEFFNKISLELNNIKSPFFYNLLLLNLPIRFLFKDDYENIFFMSIGRSISEVYKSKSNEPSNNFSDKKTVIDTVIEKYNDKSFFNEYFNWNLEPKKIGIGKIKDKNSPINVYLVLPEEHFPLKNIRYILLKERHTSNQLTIKQKEEIENNFYPALAFSYAHYFFKYTLSDIVNIHILVDGFNLSTGSKENLFFNGFSFERSLFESMSLEKILPVEAIKNFTKIKSVENQEVVWNDNKELDELRQNTFFDKKNKIFSRSYFGIGELSLFSETLINAIKILCDYKYETHSHIDLYSIKTPLDLESNEFNLIVEQLFDLNIVKCVITEDEEYYDLVLWNNGSTNTQNYNRIIEDIDKRFSNILTLKNQIKNLEKPTYNLKSKISYSDTNLATSFKDLDDSIVSSQLELKSILQKRGLDTSHIDDFLKEYYEKKI
jgi:hypothetical protein